MVRLSAGWLLEAETDICLTARLPNTCTYLYIYRQVHTVYVFGNIDM